MKILLRGQTLLAAFSFLFLFASAGFSQVISIQAESQPAVPAQMVATKLPNGDFKFTGSKEVVVETWKHKISWDIVLNGSAAGQVNEQIIKSSEVQVETDPLAIGPMNFTVEYHVPSKPYLGTLIAGAGSLKLQGNADGAQLTCSNQETGTALLAPLLDGVAVEAPLCFAYYCPFLMSMTGSGSASTSFIFANTCQGQVPRNITSMVGEKIRVAVTPGDKLTIAMSLSSSGIVPPVVPCPADLNADGKVDGLDQGILLGAWGSCPGCKADINSDGKVDGVDLGALLGAWGNCK